MTRGHAEAQEMFEELGRARGFRFRKTFSRAYPTDGLWLPPERAGRFCDLPVAAIEVVVSESAKTRRGSIATLEAVSPALGVVLIHEEEIRRRIIQSGGAGGEADGRVARMMEDARRLAQRSQHIEVWSFAALSRQHRLATYQHPVGA